MRKAAAYLLTAVLALYGAFLIAQLNDTSVLAQEAMPQLKRIRPDKISSGSPTFTLRLEGKKFAEGAIIFFDGVPLVTRFISTKVLLADVDAALVENPGAHTVQAINPDDQETRELSLTVVEQDPELSAQLTFNAIEENVGLDIIAEVTGEGFNENSVVLVGGRKSIETSFVSETRLLFVVPAKFTANSGRIPITVRRGNDRFSNTDILFVVPAPAGIGSLEPDSIEVGEEDFDLIVRGAGFKSDARIMINGVTLEPTEQREGRLEATVPGALRQQVGQLVVRVVQEGIQSRDLIFLVTPTTDPFIATIAPIRIREGENRPTIDIVGANLGDRVTALVDGVEANIRRSTRRRLTIVVPPDIRDVLGPHTVQVMDEEGNVSEIVNFEIVPDVMVSTVLGRDRDGFNPDDPCVSFEDAFLRRPRRMALGPDGLLYFTDQHNHVIRTINFETSEVCTIAGTGFSGYHDSGNSGGFEPALSFPNGLIVGPDGTIYVSDNGNNVIRRIIRGEDGITVDTFAGKRREVSDPDRQRKLNSTNIGLTGFRNGTSEEAAFRLPDGMAMAADGTIYVADSNNHSIRRITQANGDVMVETIAGNGVPGFADGDGANARFNTPIDVALSLDENRLFVADFNNHRIRVVDLLTGLVSTHAGSGVIGGDDGPAREASLSQPIGLALDSDGVLYVSELGVSRIRRVDPAGNVNTVAGDITSKNPRNGPGIDATFKNPRGLMIDRTRGILYVADYEYFLIRAIALR
ncbi:MAG: IPT/TIG domain-containing protein [Blastocatellia bacterium]|nr:IPT/TIG domain-containing protein [Blastocatellia bacterium]